MGLPIELFWHPYQKSRDQRISGHELLEYFRKLDLMRRWLSLESSVIATWLGTPQMYPPTLRSEALYLWGSMDDLGVPFLSFKNAQVLDVVWSPLSCYWSGNSPAALAPLLVVRDRSDWVYDELGIRRVA